MGYEQNLQAVKTAFRVNRKPRDKSGEEQAALGAGLACAELLLF